MSQRKNKIGRGTLILSLTSFLFFLVLAIWAFSQHGTWGLYNWNHDYRRLLNIIIGLGFLVPAVALILWLLRGVVSRTWFKVGSWILNIVSVVVIVVCIGIVFYVVVPAYSLLSSTEPKLLVEPSTGIYGIPNLYVYFRTETPTVVNVSWGTKDNLQLLNDANPVKEHLFHFTDLQPGTEYYYVIDNRMGLTFSTPPLAKTGTLVTFAVASDFHYGGSDANSDERTQILRNISEDPNVNLFFMNGDIVDLGMVNGYWSEFFSDVSENMTKPVALVLGNHDTLIGGLYHFRNYFYGADGVKIDSGNELYHRIDVGNVHFLVLEVLWGTEEFTPEQKKWLEDQLSSIPQEDWVIPISHCFYYSSGDVETGRVWADHEDTTRLISPLFEKYNVDLVISGHNHHMELLEKDGVTYVLDGVAGGNTTGPRPIKSDYSKWFYGDSRGYLEVTVKQNEAELLFKNVDGEVIQQFTITQNT